ncbi:hypothetical protein IFM53868_07156 [Aspergillus udagawae]|uniref:Fungal-type protein kinase domain-containing protein n=1 Tax=Aspergillus udagawae TaxID=91492 RepID=A0ABQ1B411_9EURO|nr:hypothetical protein IFM53868_07156 [Aspergillus udagawae]
MSSAAPLVLQSVQQSRLRLEQLLLIIGYLVTTYDVPKRLLNSNHIRDILRRPEVGWQPIIGTELYEELKKGTWEERDRKNNETWDILCRTVTKVHEGRLTQKNARDKLRWLLWKLQQISRDPIDEFVLGNKPQEGPQLGWRFNLTLLGISVAVLPCEPDFPDDLTSLTHGQLKTMESDLNTSDLFRDDLLDKGRLETALEWIWDSLQDPKRPPSILSGSEPVLHEEAGNSWQYPEREEEGKLLREAAENGVVNVARYYYHENVQIQGRLDDISGGVRKGLDVTMSANYRLTRPDVSEKTSNTAGGARSQSRRSARLKRSSSCTDAALPPSKRTCSTSSTKGESSPAVQNRVHRRVIVRDFGKPIYKAQSRSSMLYALQTCIEGYESLRTRAGYLQGDISTGNLIIRDREDHSVWPAFLIDLDLAVKEQREKPSGAKGKTGTRAFMAIGLLLGERHSFMHDLESFFWVLFWICIHYNGPGDEGRVIPRFDKWNYADMEELAEMKKGIVAHEGDFLKLASENFGEYYLPLKAWVNRLRKVVFPNGGRWEKENQMLASQMKDVLKAAVEDQKSRLADTI